MMIQISGLGLTLMKMETIRYLIVAAIYSLALFGVAFLVR